MPAIKLFYAPRTRALKTLWLLEEMGLTYEIELHELKHGNFQGQVVPGGKFPALQVGSVTMNESGAILAYLLDLYPSDLAPARTSTAWPEFLTWVHYADSTAFSVFEMLMWHTGGFEEDKRAAIVVETETPWAHAMLTHIDQALEGKDFIVANTFSAADIHLWFACQLAQRARLTSSYENVLRWMKQLQTRPALLRALKVGS
jgi:glutathione S-transferase